MVDSWRNGSNGTHFHKERHVSSSSLSATFQPTTSLEEIMMSPSSEVSSSLQQSMKSSIYDTTDPQWRAQQHGDSMISSHVVSPRPRHVSPTLQYDLQKEGNRRTSVVMQSSSAQNHHMATAIHVFSGGSFSPRLGKRRQECGKQSAREGYSTSSTVHEVEAPDWSLMGSQSTSVEYNEQQQKHDNSDLLNSSTESWRKYGKQFRADLILADDAIDENAFALSETCAIERYYRVADKVFDQFLRRDISERETLVESYLIGNRLFKFLSVVLPTHEDYFSQGSKLTQLRVKSQNQLIELLEYMEQLELLIDEIEYSTYILKDLTPEHTSNDTKNGTGEPVAHTSQCSLEDGPNDSQLPFPDEDAEEFSNGSPAVVGKGERPSRIDGKEAKGVNPVAQHPTTTRRPESFEKSCHERQVQPLGTFRGSSSDDFAQRVAAVVAASSDSDSLISLPRRSESSRALIGTSPLKHHAIRRRDTRGSESSISARPPPISPQKTSVRIKRLKGRHEIQNHEFCGNSTFGDISNPFGHFETHSTNHIDLLLDDNAEKNLLSRGDFSFKRNLSRSSGIGRSLPKLTNSTTTLLKKPPSASPRTLNASLQKDSALLTSTRKMVIDDASTIARSDFSGDVLLALEEQSMMTGTSSHNQDPPAPFKSRIEERLERAAELQKEVSTVELSQYDDSSIVERVSGGEPKLMLKFRGCIQSLLD